MQYVDVQGARVPALGLGTWQLAGRACRDTVAKALELGYRHIDTAQAYGNEAEIGSAVQAGGVPRGDLWLTTKIAVSNMTYDSAVRTAHDSLKRLAVDYVDLLLIHWPNPQVPTDESLKALDRLRQDGTARHIGLSNFTSSMLEDALQRVPLLGLQAECHPYLPQASLHRLATTHELLFTAYSPLARGEAAQDSTLREIGIKHGKSAVQVALRWLLQQPNTAAIPKASSPAHLSANLDIFDFVLDTTDLQRVEKLSKPPKRMLYSPVAPNWEGT